MTDNTFETHIPAAEAILRYMYDDPSLELEYVKEHKLLILYYRISARKYPKARINSNNILVLHSTDDDWSKECKSPLDIATLIREQLDSTRIYILVHDKRHGLVGPKGALVKALLNLLDKLLSE